MSRTNRINLAAAIGAVLASLAVIALTDRGAAVRPRAAPQESWRGARVVSLADGSRALLDASDTAVPLVAYRRIVSASTISDWLVTELCAPDQVLAVTERSAKEAPWRHRFAGLARVSSASQLEALLSMKPDLLLLDSFGDPRRVARLREHGLAVYDLGQMRGLESLLATVENVGLLCGRDERARVLSHRLERGVTSLARDIPEARRPRALYLSPYGDKLFGGTRGTGYHDMLRYAGLRDAAAEAFDGFPEYSTEQVLGLDPDLVVTRAGMAGALCRHAGFGALRACRTASAIIELDAFAIDDPGLGLIEATEALYRAAYEGADSR